ERWAGTPASARTACVSTTPRRVPVHRHQRASQFHTGRDGVLQGSGMNLRAAARRIGVLFSVVWFTACGGGGSPGTFATPAPGGSHPPPPAIHAQPPGPSIRDR